MPAGSPTAKFGDSFRKKKYSIPDKIKMIATGTDWSRNGAKKSSRNVKKDKLK